MRRIGLERQIAELVDDQQFRFAKVGEAILEPALAMGLGELGYQGRRLSEQHGIACKDRLAPDRHCQMRLAVAVAIGRQAILAGTARCVLPTPGGPNNSTASALAMKRPAAISRICFLSIEGWAAKSKPSRSRTKGKRASPMLISIRRSSLRPISRSQNRESASRVVSSRRAASSIRLSS